MGAGDCCADTWKVTTNVGGMGNNLLDFDFIGGDIDRPGVSETYSRPNLERNTPNLLDLVDVICLREEQRPHI